MTTKTKKSITQDISYLLISVITALVVCGGVYLGSTHLLFASHDLRDASVSYGEQVYYGEDDGVTYTDHLSLYDNGTFETFINDIEINGTYQFMADTLRLNYANDEKKIFLPSLFIYRDSGIYGYRMLDGQLEESWCIYFSMSEEERKQLLEVQ